MTAQKVEFQNKNGVSLSGRMVMPMRKEVRAYALFAHCFTCTKNLSATRNIARALAGEGIATLIFDFTGLGSSEGDFSDTNFSSNIEDLLAAADYLSAHHAPPSIIAGHSLGGTAALKAAAQLPSVVAVASIGSPADPAHIAHLITSKREEIEKFGRADVNLGGRSFSIKEQFLHDVESQSALEAVAHFKKALLVMHAPLDKIVDIDNANRIFLAAKHPKSFISLDKADHLLTRKEDSEYVGKMIAAWASYYLNEEQNASQFPQFDQHGAAARTRGDGFKTHISAGGHPLLADEPLKVGGTNLGPAPYDLLCSALAACTTMTLKMYSDRKGIELEAATCEVQHSKVDSTQEAGGKVDHFERELILEGAIDDEQRERMLEIANKCPVHRTLHNTITISTSLKDGNA